MSALAIAGVLALYFVLVVAIVVFIAGASRAGARMDERGMR